MNSLIIFKANESSSLCETLVAMGGESRSDGRVVIEKTNGWISVEELNDPFSDYDETEKNKVFSKIDNPAGFLVEWRNDGELQILLDELEKDGNVVIDNDHGIIAQLSDVNSVPISIWLRSNSLDS